MKPSTGELYAATMAIAVMVAGMKPLMMQVMTKARAAMRNARARALSSRRMQAPRAPMRSATAVATRSVVAKARPWSARKSPARGTARTTRARASTTIAVGSPSRSSAGAARERVTAEPSLRERNASSPVAREIAGKSTTIVSTMASTMAMAGKAARTTVAGAAPSASRVRNSKP